MTTFRITYTDPMTQERETIDYEAEDTPAVPGVHGAIPARMWAEDHVYMLADKRGDYIFKEVKLPAREKVASRRKERNEPDQG